MSSGHVFERYSDDIAFSNYSSPTYTQLPVNTSSSRALQQYNSLSHFLVDEQVPSVLGGVILSMHFTVSFLPRDRVGQY